MTSHLNVHFVVARRHKYSVLVLGFAYYNFLYQLELTIKMDLIAVFARGFSIIVSMDAFFVCFPFPRISVFFYMGVCVAKL